MLCSLSRISTTLRRLARDESANALPEYAIVMTAVTVISYLAFLSLASTSSNAVVTNQNNLSSSSTASYLAP